MVGARHIRVRGLVQGVGFRPHVWRIATGLGLKGSVRNDGAGVEIHIWGEPEQLDHFQTRLETETPPLAHIDGIDWQVIDMPPPDGFEIVASVATDVATGVVPDAATCPDCLAEINDPANRRYGYAFTNCTHCGPRLSIVEAIPYDRANTSMRAFDMCPDCVREYADPADRRFHAQPNACPTCGPKLWLEDAERRIECADAIAEAARLICEGKTVAIKGIGGFHLACDATSEEAVAELRRRKRRAAKPFAVMAPSIESVRRFASASDAEKEALLSPAAPIVLLSRHGERLAPSIAPSQARVGVMLPYSPPHHLLMQALDRPIVLTSGNVSDEPQVIANDEAKIALAGLADLWLLHDRDIVNRLDDSVVSLDGVGSQTIRRGRGLAPAPLHLKGLAENGPKVLAMGGELKSAFCLLRGDRAILSQHIGDLEHAASFAEYRKAIALYRDLYRFDPDIIAIDKHPDYLSTQLGHELAETTGAELVEVQHHHAHLAACLAENQVPLGEDQAMGIVLDGLGLGDDGTVWGGEILVGGYAGFERAGHFLPVALPGGAQAIREPWRNTVAHLEAAFGEGWAQGVSGTPLEAMLAEKPVGTLQQMMRSGLNTPLCSSAGRLFDAVAAAVGICPNRQEYEGQAAMEMEAAALAHLVKASPYPVAHSKGGDSLVLSWEPMWQALLGDLRGGKAPGHIAARFHLGMAEAITKGVRQVSEETGIRRVALSGGVMQNSILRAALHQRLAAEGFEVLVHREVPANDGGLALGQAAIARATA